MAGVDAAGGGAGVARAEGEAAVGVVGIVGAAGLVRGQRTDGVRRRYINSYACCVYGDTISPAYCNQAGSHGLADAHAYVGPGNICAHSPANGYAGTTDANRDTYPNARGHEPRCDSNGKSGCT